MRRLPFLTSRRSTNHFRPYLAVLAAAALAAGCASIESVPDRFADRLGPQARECGKWFDALDRAVDAAGVRDASAYRVPSFAYLRADRFSASFRQVASRGAPQFEAWAERLRALDLEARSYETSNLPASAIDALHAGDRQAVAARTVECSARLAHEDLADASRREALVAHSAVPDDYRSWVRDSGVYALSALPFSVGVEGWHREAEEMFRKAASGEESAANLRRYAPAGAPVEAEQVRAILARAKPDALGVPQLAPGDKEILFRAYAPRYEIDTTGPHDRFGSLGWGDGKSPVVALDRPVVYRRLAYTRYGERSLLQLVYTAWFPERPPAGMLDLLAGALDGLVFRVTLDEQGAPLVFDTIHPCGCYHMFFPTASVKPVPPPDAREEWAFIPSVLPALAPARSAAIRIASGTHYVVGVWPAAAGPAEAYDFADDDALRALPAPGGGTKSVFGPDGLVAGTERAERAFFWPMGIVSPGTMRQWGRQPTAFLGRRHFDDADLIERRFVRATGHP